jgi:hypothetical protein
VKKPTSDPFKEAQIMGEIQTLPSVEEKEIQVMPEPLVDPKDEVVTDPGNFLYALSRAKLDQRDYLIVSKEILGKILNGRPGHDVMYEGVRLFEEGHKDELLRQNRMNAEDYSNEVGRKKMQAQI